MEAQNIATQIRNREVKVQFILWIVNNTRTQTTIYIFEFAELNCFLFLDEHHAKLSKALSNPFAICRKIWTGNGAWGKRKTYFVLKYINHFR